MDNDWIESKKNCTEKKRKENNEEEEKMSIKACHWPSQWCTTIANKSALRHLNIWKGFFSFGANLLNIIHVNSYGNR